MAGKQEAFSAEENRLLRAAVRKLYEERGLKSQTALGELLGVKQQTAGKLLGTTPTGMGRRTANTLAKLLGYPDAEHFLRESALVAVMTEPDAGPWGNRDMAIRIAERLDYLDTAVAAVVTRHAAIEASARPVKWWLQKFGLEELELAADALIASSRAPPRKRTA